MTWYANVLCEGEAEAEVLRINAPISFWGGVSPDTSCVTQAGHPQHGQSVAGKIVVIPELVGSSSSSAVLLELIYQRIAPAGLILGAADAILPVGVLVSRQMGWGGLPVLAIPNPPFQTANRLVLGRDGSITQR